MAGEQLVKDGTKSINIRCPCDLLVLAARLFRRHVTWRAQHLHRARHRTLRFDQSRQAKVGEMRFACSIDEYIARLNVSMHNPVLMRVMHGARHLRDQFRRLPDRYRLAPDYFIKLTSLNKLHAEVTGAIALADFIDGNDAWMIEAGGSFRFPAKALQVCCARPLTKADYL
jgi:hypothetical protein